jgi:hypothetical protein
MTSQDTSQVNSATGRPLQRIPWEEKNKGGKKWWKHNVDYGISMSIFNSGNTNLTTNNKRNVRSLYQIYNNQFPSNLFDHITNPLNAQNAAHKKYPAKIRPTAMIRTNLDLLMGEFNKRPFSYQVDNLGEDAYNSYTENLSKSIQQNLTEHFIAIAQDALKAAGHKVEEIPQEEQIELPESVKERFTVGYKDNIAIRAQRWTKRAIREYNIRQILAKGFKDWLIAGQVTTYKNIEHGVFVYEHVPPLEFDFIKSPNKIYGEDAEVQVRRQFLTVSDCVDKFFDELKEEDHVKLENKTYTTSVSAMYDYLNAQSSNLPYAGRVPVYHVCWKGKKEVQYVEYTDEFTGEVNEMMLDEDVPKTEGMKVVRTEWHNEAYEGWRIGDDIYPRLRAIPVQRNEMNNFSSCKLPYNTRMFSDTHADNISVCELGVSYAIMYMIVNFTLEKTIAKNKGKITLIDQNSIPKQNGWDDEKFFYYADALGYMLINRNQQGVDKSFNQYSTLDMSLFSDITNLIELRDSFKRDWDDLLGITPPRKGQSAPNMDGLGVQQNSLFQSSVITDTIFTLYEEFIEKELQGVIDFSKFINVDGVRAIYNSDDFDTTLLDIDPNTYCNAELGVFIQFSANELNTLNQYKANVQAMIQNGAKASTILAITKAMNTSELESKLNRLEEIEMQQAQANVESEKERQIEIEEVQGRIEKTKSLLRIDEINVEYDRKEALEMVKGEYQLYSFGGDGDNNNNGIPDASEISKRVIAQQQTLSAERQKQTELMTKQRMQEKELSFRREELKVKERMNTENNKTALKNKASGE